jgi:hypothetical protein
MNCKRRVKDPEEIRSLRIPQIHHPPKTFQPAFPK